MDYEKKYNEALERARSMYESKDDAELAAFIFPELAESEDERIRKEIINYILYRAGRVLLDKETEHRFVAYLEKQKEQKPAEWSEEDEHRKKDAIYFLESAKKHYADTSEIEKTIGWLKSLQLKKL